MISVKILTSYPEMFPGSLKHSLIGRALKENIFTIDTINLHDFGIDNRKSVDDEPFGGGPGMILRPDVVEKALFSISKKQILNSAKIYLTPSGTLLNQKKLGYLSKLEEIIILCGRFEGVDQRAIDILGFEEISIGDYVLAGGEIAAQVLLEGCIRLIPGVLGHPESLLEESFSNNLLEYPQYTRPQVWEDSQGNKHDVPEVLTSGHHGNIKKWRQDKSVDKTKKIRPDLIIKKEQEQD
ncbi:MAG: tRNA (guanosine(37)-N1)-methyltransferase TrmD [Pelagibacteraceae bacterium]|jgi:tRNA (guanine37-N1)-methyltransferase|nr:tRNA (guanosine(37)-N1)-methyltransferase TrmD [Pelagibacteraceae bacterium]MBT5212941.1 tRNA (guanosine(37)-N1)-methyltransferase TrmD [Pelagibacteraceae bacterium]